MLSIWSWICNRGFWSRTNVHILVTENLPSVESVKLEEPSDNGITDSGLVYNEGSDHEWFRVLTEKIQPFTHRY